jgi:protein-tyrosine phosphatase
MIDLHHHLLPGLDDGSDSFETSVAMARIAADDGITHIVCTPHANSRYTFDPQVNAEKTYELQALLADAGIAMTLGRGCDFHISYDNIQAAQADPKRFSINGLGYLLVEVPDYGLPRGLTETFYQLQLAGLTPILTHPERNPTIQADMSRLIDWQRGGVLIQVTADSVTGHKGKVAQRIAHELLENRWVHFLATDAHNTKSRPPRMREARNVVANKYGARYAENLCVTYPLAVFLGERLELEEEPKGLYENLKEPGWWQRLTAAMRTR